jgi:hypothetical protein
VKSETTVTMEPIRKGLIYGEDFPPIAPKFRLD